MPAGRLPRCYIRSRTVGVAQLVELLVVVQAVGGSSPLAHPPFRLAGPAPPRTLPVYCTTAVIFIPGAWIEQTNSYVPGCLMRTE